MDKDREEYLEFIEIAYRLIRIKARNIVNPCTDAELGEYVRGVVDMQSEMYGNNQYSKANHATKYE